MALLLLRRRIRDSSLFDAKPGSIEMWTCFQRVTSRLRPCGEEQTNLMVRRYSFIIHSLPPSHACLHITYLLKLNSDSNGGWSCHVSAPLAANQANLTP